MTSLATVADYVPISLDYAPAAKIKAVMQQLAAPRERIERKFLDVGGSLGECVQIIRQITTAFDSLAGSTNGHADTDATHHLETLSRRALALAASTGRTKGEDNGLGRLMEMISTVRRPVSELERTVKLIGLVAVSTRINAAHLTGTHEDFTIFTTDIGRLSEHVARTVKEFASVYGGLVTTLAAANTKQIRFEAEHEETMRLLVGRLEKSLNTAEESRQRVASASADMSASFRRISGGVGAAVSALQIGDITRQRVEHVEEALELLLQSIGDAGSDPLRASATVAAVCRLQSAQTRETVDHFDGDIKGLINTLHQLAQDASAIVEQSDRIHGVVVLSHQEAVTDLTSEVRQACGLIRAGQDTRNECDQAARSVVSSLQDLLTCVEAVQEIEADMQIVSLNMGLKCARLGAQGQTLNVIAQELRTLTAQTVVQARAAISNLKAAASFAESLAARNAGDAGNVVDDLEAEVIEAISEQDASDSGLTETTDVLARDGARAAALLADVAAGVTIGTDIGGALRTAGKQIDAIREDALVAYASAGGDDIGPAEAAAVAQLSVKYTMASERLMHGRFADGASGSVSDAQAPAADEDDLDALFL